MNADERGYLNEVAEHVIGAAFEVSNHLGAGFLEKVYQRALCHGLVSRGHSVEVEKRLIVRYKGVVVGEYMADLMVDERIIVELKCVETFANEHTAQCLNYLRATGLKLALLLNFQKSKVDVKRIVLNF